MIVNNLKVALCLSGQMRFFDDGWQSVKELVVNPLNADVFLHTWETSDNRPNFIGEYKEHILQKMSPSIYFVEPQISFERLGGCSNRTVSMYYSMNYVNKLKSWYESTHNFKYDVVIRSRIDNASLETPKLENFNYEVLYCLPFGNGYFQDQFFYGSSDVMNKVTNIFHDLNKLPPKEDPGPEVTLGEYVRNVHKIPYSFIPQGIWYIKR